MILIALSMSYWDYMKRIKYIKNRIETQYGKEIDLQEVKTKMSSASSYYRNKNNKSSIDD